MLLNRIINNLKWATKRRKFSGVVNLSQSKLIDPAFFKIVIIGDSNVGKSCLIHRYVKSQYFKDFKPTIGAEFSNKEVLIDGKIVVTQIWDTAGQERYQSLSTSFYRGADWWAIVFDLTNKDSFDSLNQWRKDFIKHLSLTSEKYIKFQRLNWMYLWLYESS